MGYMGIGYQKWISQQKVRRFLVRRKIPIHSRISGLHKSKDFTPHQNTGIARKRWYHVGKSALLILPLLILLTFSLFAFLTRGEPYYYHKVANHSGYSDTEVNQILIRSIKSNVKRGNYNYAMEEIATLKSRTLIPEEVLRLELEIAPIVNKK